MPSSACCSPVSPIPWSGAIKAGPINLVQPQFPEDRHSLILPIILLLPSRPTSPRPRPRRPVPGTTATSPPLPLLVPWRSRVIRQHPLALRHPRSASRPRLPRPTIPRLTPTTPLRPPSPLPQRLPNLDRQLRRWPVVIAALVAPHVVLNARSPSRRPSVSRCCQSPGPSSSSVHRRVHRRRGDPGRTSLALDRDLA